MNSISLFSGILGLDLGFIEKGVKLRAVLDIYPPAVETIKANYPRLKVIDKDIFTIKTADILKKANLKVGEVDILTGGPPCQTFSTAGKRTGVNHKKGQLVFEYLRVIKEAQPQVFVFENVSGLLSAAEQHVSFYERQKKAEDELSKEQQLGSAFNLILGEFEKTGYILNWQILNAADYGAPQKRRRLIMIGSRNGDKIPMPVPSHYKPGSLPLPDQKPWITLKEAFNELPKEQEYTPLPKWGKYMKYVPPGGCWRDIPKELHAEAMKGAYKSQGGRTGYYRRLSWDAPSPTVVTSPLMKATALVHPSEDRPLSVEEYKRIQGFPDYYKLVGSTNIKYRLLGEAVPVQLSRAIATQVIRFIVGVKK